MNISNLLTILCLLTAVVLHAQIQPADRELPRAEIAQTIKAIEAEHRDLRAYAKKLDKGHAKAARSQRPVDDVCASAARSEYQGALGELLTTAEAKVPTYLAGIRQLLGERASGEDLRTLVGFSKLTLNAELTILDNHLIAMEQARNNTRSGWSEQCVADRLRAWVIHSDSYRLLLHLSELAFLIRLWQGPAGMASRVAEETEAQEQYFAQSGTKPSSFDPNNRGMLLFIELAARAKAPQRNAAIAKQCQATGGAWKPPAGLLIFGSCRYEIK